MRKISLIILVFLISIFGLTSCKKDKKIKPTRDNPQCVLEKEIIEGELVEGELEEYTYAVYKFTPKETGFYNSSCLALFYDGKGNEIKAYLEGYARPYSVLAPDHLFSTSPCIYNDDDSDIYYLNEGAEYKITVHSNSSLSKHYNKKEYKLMISKAEFNVEALVYNAYTKVNDDLILIIRNIDDGKYYFDNIEEIWRFFIYDISYIDFDELARNTTYSTRPRHPLSYNDSVVLESGKIYAVVFEWKSTEVDYLLVKPELKKVE